MKKELQEQLFDKYPKIFRQRTLPSSQTSMCCGIDCGDGWFSLINCLCEAIQNHVDEAGTPQVEATQVKEKYGGLCFYVTNADGYVWSIIGFAEDILSHSICEQCGTTADVKTREDHWVYTLCNACDERRKGKEQEEDDDGI